MKTKALTRTVSSIELLEARIAPASLTFTDVDGDLVHVTVSGSATTAQLDAAVHRVPSGAGFEITSVAFGGRSVFKNADITIVADLAGGGDGLVNVGRINARGIDLHDITIDGNLVEIDAGDTNTATTAISHLTAESFGVPIERPGNAPTSFIKGGVATIEIHGDVNKAWIRVGAPHRADGGIGTIMIAGSLIGGSALRTGAITASGEITNATVGGDLIGGSGRESGTIGTFGFIASANVGGITGAAGAHSGALLSRGGMGAVTVNDTINGGSGVESGAVGSLRTIGAVIVHGEVLGGAGKRSGEIVSKSSLGTVSIDGNLQGGAGAISGAVGSKGNIDTVSIGGSLIGGKQEFTGAIVSGASIGDVSIGSAIRTDPTVSARFTAIISARGNIDNLSAAQIIGTQNNRVLIAAAGDVHDSAKAGNRALGDIVTGPVSFASFLAGFGFCPGQTFKNADAAVGSVEVFGDWIASTVAAGALVSDRLFAGFDNNDVEFHFISAGGNRAVFSRIASVEIMGAILSDAATGVLSGFVAEQIVSIVSEAGAVPLTSGPHNDQRTIENAAGNFAAIVDEGLA